MQRIADNLRIDQLHFGVFHEDFVNHSHAFGRLPTKLARLCAHASLAFLQLHRDLVG
jgi:hypothetical protein